MSAACFGDDASVPASTCLLGEPSRYDGGSARHSVALRLFEAGLTVPVCPKLFGGLPGLNHAAGLNGPSLDVRSRLARVAGNAMKTSERAVIAR